MATQVRIRRRGRTRAFFVAGCFAALSVVPASAALATPRHSASAVAPTETTNGALLPFGGSDLALLSLSGIAALGIGSMVARKADV